jgi:ABC-type lipoprotein release transport system permease subunit
MKTAIGMWARSEMARRWRGLVALGVLAGLVGGLALAAVAGARRTSDAYDRYREATGRSDAIVFATLLGIFDADYGPVRNLPEVEDAGEFALTTAELDGVPGSGTLAPNDDRLYRTINRPLLVAGRLPDPGRVDEMVVNRAAAEELGVKVGSELTIVSSTSMDVGGPMDGPTVRATVVGIGDSNIDLGFMAGGPSWTPSAAFLATHPEIPRATNLVVRLRPGTDVAAFGRRAAEAMGLPNLPVRDLTEDTKRVTRGTDLERTALLIFAVAVALAGLVLAGQTVARTVYALAEPSPALRAIGFTRRGLLAGLLLPVALTAVVAAVVALVAAVVLSRWFPVGLAGQLEPDGGVHADWPVLLPGALLVAAAALGGAAVSALRATAASPPRPTIGTAFSLTRALRRIPALPAVIGAGLALERGEGTRALPVRPALASGIIAVVGVVGAFGLLVGIDDALARPERSGQFWDASLSSTEGVAVTDMVAALEADEQVGGLTVLRTVDLEVGGVSVPVYAMEAAKGDRSFTVLEGRPPSGDRGVVIGPATARALGRGIGDVVTIGGRQVDVVGLGLLPQTPHFSFDQGMWTSAGGFDTLAPAAPEGSLVEAVLVEFAPGVDAGAAIPGIAERLPGVEIERREMPQDVSYLANVRTLPKALAGFLVLLGVGALGHVLATAVRRRRHDLAVLRALGFRPVQVAACVAWQAVTVSLVALLAGIPLGIASGRWSWRWVADSTPLLYVPPVAAAVVVISIPAALVLANAIAALPARKAARLRPAEVLRAE